MQKKKQFNTSSLYKKGSKKLEPFLLSASQDFQTLKYWQRVSAMVVPEVCKDPNGFSNSPDGGSYPFVLGFRTKDSAGQRELPLLEKPGHSLLKKPTENLEK